MESLNRMALELVDEAMDFADELAIGVFNLENGSTVLDFGVERDGGIEAGLLLAELQTAGLATVQTRMGEIDGAPIPHVELVTDHPGIALLGSQKAGWELSVDGFEGLGSGPARALVGEEVDFERIGYVDAFDFAILAVESDELPGPEVAAHVSRLSGVEPSQVFLASFKTGSIVGSVSMAARAAELAVFRLTELGYDPNDVLSASASAPVAPVAGDEETAIGRTNDALAFGGRVHLIVREAFDEFESVPSTATDAYGTPFGEIFADADWDFYEIPESVFAPAQVVIDVVGGETTAYGATNEALLVDSFGLG